MSDGGEVSSIGELLSEQLGIFARAMQAESDPDALLAEIVRSAVALIPGTDEGSVSLVTRRRKVTSLHPTSTLPERVDALQAETGQGPCLDALYQEQTVRVPDMAAERRWPDFARRATEEGAASMLSFQLFTNGDNLGALNLFGRQPHGFTEESEQIGLLFASQAAVAFAGARKVENLQIGLQARDLIGQAKGILMERFKLTPEQAFSMLAKVSQHTNRSLRAVAEELTLTGTLPIAGPDDAV